MSRVMRTIAVRHAVFGLALTGLAMSSMSNAKAGDLYPPTYRSYPPTGPIDQRVLERERYRVAPLVNQGVEFGGGICRTFHERRVDPYGRETIHRIRMCDDGPIYATPNWTAVPPEYGNIPGPYYESSGYVLPPRPPVAVGSGYYD